MKKRTFLVVSTLALIVFVAVAVVFFIVSQHRYSNADFGIGTFVSDKDKDMDGLDDQTDILESTKNYLATKPKYKSKYYATGYPDDEYGVCTDVVAFALLGAGYDLQELVDTDIRENPDFYDIDVVDKNIDFRRVDNLKTFFDRNAEVLTTDVHDIAEWQGGDIVVFKDHIGIVSEKRNRRGLNLVYHHESPWQFNYEQDILDKREIVGHYRMGTKQLFAKFYEQADDMLATMTLEEKVAQMFLVRFPDGDELQKIVDAKPGGFILFAKDFQDETPETISKNLRGLQESSDVNFIFGVDEEGGTVTRISRFPAFRKEKFLSPQELYAQGGLELILEDTKEKSKLLASLGINMNLAPVADVSTRKTSFMYERTLGQTAEETADYVEAVVREMNSDDVISVLKHFPGYGNNSDTHTGVAIDERSYEELEQVDLLPFVAGIRANAPVILVSHNIVKSMDDSMPASLSKNVHDILRSKLDFTGVIMTDDLAMDAVKQYAAHGEAATDAVLAGNDMIITSDFLHQKQEVINAVQSGEIPEDKIVTATRRILAMKMAYKIMDDATIEK